MFGIILNLVTPQLALIAISILLLLVILIRLIPQTLKLYRQEYHRVKYQEVEMSKQSINMEGLLKSGSNGFKN